MNYSLFKLKFDTAVHFGSSDSAQSLSSAEDHLCADTLFSALCHTALQLEGEALLNKLCDWVREGSFLLSDTMPWREEQYYLPKPLVQAQHSTELSSVQRKAMKKLNWIPVQSMAAFEASVRGGESYDPLANEASFGFRTEVTKAAVVDGEDARPYQVGLFCFEDNCGLYVLAGTERAEQRELLEKLLRCLGFGGVGGKVSSGYGKFHLCEQLFLNEARGEQAKWFCKALRQKSGHQLLLTTSLPREDELEQALEGAAYHVSRRSGFVASETFAETERKKQTQFFLKAGAVLNSRFRGDLYSVGVAGGHPVYRYGKPLLLGVDF